MDALNNQPESRKPKSRILVVEEEPSACALLTGGLSAAGFECWVANSGSEAISILEADSFDVVICDLRMPEVSGLELLVEVRKMHPHAAFLMVTGVGDVGLGIQAMNQGADGYILKPFCREAVALAVEHALNKKRLEMKVEADRGRFDEMVNVRTKELQAALGHINQIYDETSVALGAAFDLKDRNTAGHAGRVAHYSLEIAKAMNCSEDEMHQFMRAAYLHDIGMVGIPDAVLRKPAKLSSVEMSVMRNHPRIGYELIGRIPFLAPAAEIVLAHHERFDGTGYPQGLKEDDIPLGARIVAVAEAFDVMLWDQPYRKARSFDEAVAEICHCSGTQFDPKVVAAFLDWAGIHGDPRKQQ